LQVRVVLIIGKIAEHKPEHRISNENAAEDVGGGIEVVYTCLLTLSSADGKIPTPGADGDWWKRHE
jgi:hypothetical protein